MMPNKETPKHKKIKNHASFFRSGRSRKTCTDRKKIIKYATNLRSSSRVRYRYDVPPNKSCKLPMARMPRMGQIQWFQIIGPFESRKTMLAHRKDSIPAAISRSD